jgi:hypothetical protein
MKKYPYFTTVTANYQASRQRETDCISSKIRVSGFTRERDWRIYSILAGAFLASTQQNKCLPVVILYHCRRQSLGLSFLHTSQSDYPSIQIHISNKTADLSS